MDGNKFDPFIKVGSGERKIVCLGVAAEVEGGGTVLVNAHGVARLHRGAVAFVMKDGDVVAEPGTSLYLELNRGYFATLNADVVLNGLEGVKFKDLYDMPDWFWHRKDFGWPGNRQ